MVNFGGGEDHTKGLPQFLMVPRQVIAVASTYATDIVTASLSGVSASRKEQRSTSLLDMFAQLHIDHLPQFSFGYHCNAEQQHCHSQWKMNCCFYCFSIHQA